MYKVEFTKIHLAPFVLPGLANYDDYRTARRGKVLGSAEVDDAAVNARAAKSKTGTVQSAADLAAAAVCGDGAVFATNCQAGQDGVYQCFGRFSGGKGLGPVCATITKI